jgi:hypothetical protein
MTWEKNMSIKNSEAEYAGYNCEKIESDYLDVYITKSVGPRIIHLSLKDGENLFAVVPETKISIPGFEDYHLRGGHRLWYAPENPAISYIPDDRPVETKMLKNTMHIIQPVDKPTGVQKSLSINLSEEHPAVFVDHHLMNLGNDPIELAPWAITQMRVGGVAILPQPRGKTDRYGLLPNRLLTLWPYSEINSPHLDLGDQFIFLHAQFESGFFKIGFPNPLGWIGYYKDRTLFVKKSIYIDGAEYYDMGSSSECYCNNQFLELETLGPVVVLEPGETVNHQEEWVVIPEVEFSPDEQAASELFSVLGLI